MQAFLSFKTRYSTLFHIIPYYTKIFAIFFGYFADFLYLCTIIAHTYITINFWIKFLLRQAAKPSLLIILISFLNKTRYATKSMFNHGPHAVGPDVFPLCSAPNRLAETPWSSCCRSEPCAPHQAEAPHVPSCRSKHYLPPIRAALNCPFLGIFGISDFT